MEEYYTQKDIADQWQKISDEAIKKAGESKSDFRADAVYIGGMTVIGGGLIATLNGGQLSSLFLAAAALTGVLYSHVKHTYKKKYYEAFASHALDQKDNSIILQSDNPLTLPRFDKENKEFGINYKHLTSGLKSIFSLRTVIVAAVVGTSVMAYMHPDKEQPDILRPEEKETNATQGSFSAPKTSLRPVPHP
jgi:hypothetical protein